MYYSSKDNVTSAREPARPLWISTLIVACHIAAVVWFSLNPPRHHRYSRDDRAQDMVIVQMIPQHVDRKTTSANSDRSLLSSQLAKASSHRERIPRLSSSVQLPAVAPVDDSNTITAVPATSVEHYEPQLTEPGEQRFDLESARAVARVTAREQGTSVSDRDTKAVGLTREEKLGNAIERSRRDDCQTRYASMGILAIAPLLMDAAGRAKCKWK
jgi:hypothetical protein